MRGLIAIALGLAVWIVTIVGWFLFVRRDFLAPFPLGIFDFLTTFPLGIFAGLFAGICVAIATYARLSKRNA
jgi:hypothetical protein